MLNGNLRVGQKVVKINKNFTKEYGEILQRQTDSYGTVFQIQWGCKEQNLINWVRKGTFGIFPLQETKNV
jgi:hypothetical protein